MLRKENVAKNLFFQLSAVIESNDTSPTRRPSRRTVGGAEGVVVVGRAASVYTEMQICRAFNSPAPLIIIIIIINDNL